MTYKGRFIAIYQFNKEDPQITNTRYNRKRNDWQKF